MPYVCKQTHRDIPEQHGIQALSEYIQTSASHLVKKDVMILSSLCVLLPISSNIVHL